MKCCESQNKTRDEEPTLFLARSRPTATRTSVIKVIELLKYIKDSDIKNMICGEVLGVDSYIILLVGHVTVVYGKLERFIQKQSSNE